MMLHSHYPHRALRRSLNRRLNRRMDRKLARILRRTNPHLLNAIEDFVEANLNEEPDASVLLAENEDYPKMAKNVLDWMQKSDVREALKEELDILDAPKVDEDGNSVAMVRYKEQGLTDGILAKRLTKKLGYEITESNLRSIRVAAYGQLHSSPGTGDSHRIRVSKERIDSIERSMEGAWGAINTHKSMTVRLAEAFSNLQDEYKAFRNDARDTQKEMGDRIIALEKLIAAHDAAISPASKTVKGAKPKLPNWR